MSRHLGYLRVSTDEQREKCSVEMQRDLLTRFFDAHGITCAGWYVDDGVSGTLTMEQRPESARLLRDVRPGDHVHVWKLDRLGRGARLILNGIHTLEERGAETVSLTERFDTSTTAGRFLRTILAGGAELERDLIVERTTEGCYNHARNGVWLGGPCAPFGYRLAGEGRERRLVPDEESAVGAPPRAPAAIVRELFRALVEERVSSRELARRLNAALVPTLFGYRSRPHSRHSRPPTGLWNETTVRSILTSTTYRGERAYGVHSRVRKEIIYQAVPPLVSVELWDAAQLQLRANQRLGLRPALRPYLLRGLLLCAFCGRNYVGTAKGPKGATRYYQCRGKTAPMDPAARCSESRLLPADTFERSVWGEVTAALLDPDTLLERARRQLMENAPDLEQAERDRADVERALHAQVDERNTVFTLRRRGLMTDVELERQLGELAREESLLRARLDECDHAAEHAARGAVGILRLEGLLADWKERLDTGEVTPQQQMECLAVWVERLATDGRGHQLTLRLWH